MAKKTVTIIDLLNKIHWKLDKKTMDLILSYYHDLIGSDKFTTRVSNSQKIYFNQTSEQYEYFFNDEIL